MNLNSKKWETAFSSMTDLSSYNSNALGLFALGLYFELDDLHTIAAESITDGPNDRKCDIVYCDPEEGVAVICQCYMTSKNKNVAPVNKADELIVAINELLLTPIEELSERLKFSAKELRQGIESELIQKIFIWFVHNLDESTNVRQSLQNIERATQATVSKFFNQKPHNVSVQAIEVGNRTLDEWYTAISSAIIVNEEFEIKINDGFEISQAEWKAYITYIPATFLYEQFKKYKTDLFSANIRNYLGSRAKDSNINNGIKETAKKTPANFWVYNNGLTAIVHDYQISSDKKTLKIIGLSIVNGAQTTGAIGSLENEPNTNLVVAIRFIKTTNQDVVKNIIRFNNSQNKITATDFRSNDKVQCRLIEEFSKIPEAEYLGGRRGGYEDIIKRRLKLLPSYTVGQALAAVHGDPVIAYNEKSKIWEDNDIYNKYFNESTNAKHIVFCYSLLRATTTKKAMLLEKEGSNILLTQDEKEQLSYFRKRGSIYLLVSAISDCFEILLSKAIPNIFRLSFESKVSPKKAEEYWQPIVDIGSSFSIHLGEAVKDGLRSKDDVKKVISLFRTLLHSTKVANEHIYNEFSKKVFSN